MALTFTSMKKMTFHPQVEANISANKVMQGLGTNLPMSLSNENGCRIFLRENRFN